MARGELRMVLPCHIKRDDEAGVFVSHCPSLNVYSQGETEREAIDAIQSALHLYISAAYRFDKLDQILHQAGFWSLDEARI